MIFTRIWILLIEKRNRNGYLISVFIIFWRGPSAGREARVARTTWRRRAQFGRVLPVSRQHRPRSSGTRFESIFKSQLESELLFSKMSTASHCLLLLLLENWRQIETRCDVRWCAVLWSVENVVHRIVALSSSRIEEFVMKWDVCVLLWIWSPNRKRMRIWRSPQLQYSMYNTCI